MTRGRDGSVTSTIESPVDVPVRARRRPWAEVYPQLPEPETGPTPPGGSSWWTWTWLAVRSAKSTWAMRRIWTAAAADPGVGFAPVSVGSAPGSSPPHDHERAAARARPW